LPHLMSVRIAKRSQMPNKVSDPVDRRAFLTMVAAGAANPVLQRAAAVQPAPEARNIILVHGLFADGSCWSEVIARLQPKGLQVTSVQNPLTTPPEAVASAQRVLADQEGPTVLVGHSFSGMIVTEAGVDRQSSTLPRGRPMLVRTTRRSPGDFRRPRPRPAWSGLTTGEGSARRASVATSPATFPRTKARVLYAVQAPFNRSLLAGKTTHAAWRSKPSWYVVSTEDRSINPDLERFMAKRMGARTIEVKASHLSLISQPDVITDLILSRADRYRPMSRCALPGADQVSCSSVRLRSSAIRDKAPSRCAKQLTMSVDPF
jgi:pimeloyl-ACP methyl ester carboxylesterase